MTAKKLTEVEEHIVHDLISMVRTVGEREILREAIHLFSDEIYRSEKKESVASLYTDIPQRFVEKVEKTFSAALREGNRDDIQGIIQQSLLALDGLTPVVIETAFEPSEDAIDAFSIWIRRNIGDTAILDNRMDHSLGGGARIMFRGRFMELTLSELIERILNDRKQEILKSVMS